MSEFTRTSRTRLRRLPRRGAYDREAIYRILDEAMVCHVGFVAEGQPYVIPTGYARRGDTLYIHGSAASRMLMELRNEIPACITVTLLDGLVLARSAFHHSMNYRSVVALGVARLIDDPERKMEALEAITEHIVPGRWAEARRPTPKELSLTTVLEFPLNESSAKIRTGPPIDDDEDYALPIWAGELPFTTNASAPVPDPRLAPGIKPPPYVTNYARPKTGV